MSNKLERMSNNCDITANDFEKVCRTCLSKENLKHLYEKCFSPTCLVDMLMACTIVKFTEDDGLPSKICTNCILEINQAFSFAKRCETIDTILRNCLKTIKTELVNDSSQFQTVDSIIKEEEELQIEIKPETVLSNIRSVEEVIEEYKFVEVKQEDYVEEDKQKENMHVEYVEVKQEMDLADEMDIDEDQEETNLEKSDHSGFLTAERRENFSNLQALQKRHETTKHPRNNYHTSCSVCNKMIGRRWMKRHLETHSGEKSHCCDICGDSFSQNNSLIQHKQVQHSQPSDPMYNTRTKSFKRLDQMREKNVNLVLNKDFHCTLCDQAFTTEILLQQHFIIHEEKKFWCSVCEKAFVSKDLLDSHSKIHLTVQSHACHTCGKTFSKLGYLITHELIHTSENSNVCSVCSKAFTNLTSLRYHMRIHTGEKPYTCAICSTTFAQSTHLKYHMRIHTGKKSYM